MSINSKKLNSTLNNIALFFILFTLGFYLLSIIKRYPLEKDILKDYAFVLGILCTGMIACLVNVVSGKIKTDKASIISIFGLSLIMLFVWNHFIKAVPMSDYRVLWEGASQIADGTFYNRAINLTNRLGN